MVLEIAGGIVLAVLGLVVGGYLLVYLAMGWLGWWGYRWPWCWRCRQPWSREPIRALRRRWW